MLTTLLIVVVAFTASFLAVVTFRPMAIGLGLVDRPCSRKQHTGNVPLVGGLAIYTAVCLSSFLFVQFDTNYKLYLISTAFMVLIGALDDFHDLDAGLRLIAQFLIGALMVFGAELYISDLGNLFGMGTVELGPFGPLFTLLAVVASINAFNMTDGVDGLVGSLSITAFVAIGVLALLSGGVLFTEVPAMFFGAIFAFMFFNLGQFRGGKYKVFMGDAGSMLIGLTMIWLLAYSSQGSEAFIQPVTALWVIAIPIMDMVSVMLRRILAGLSPLQASRDHLHHILLFNGCSSQKTTLYIATLAVLFSIAGLLGQIYGISESKRLLVFVVLFVIYNGVMMRQDTKMMNHLKSRPFRLKPKD
ncbi:UDP-N-acetylglucosamine--undecaprenyl-phosphate N-acetylglucosaminephosphotransferase [Lacimicrobium sp. SS2-24]|uniref:UDP-N-acetylglucosamine--undecaprenyl-phosphate N-acetylglucosaminephosphotransferase n=1 Tax=Lacimicrobium sp. SS2-24 TaxID=2005569 RepID=UPI001FEF4E17|nr:UDP-N-acetylglucosamine--undecaprenyl-phosphate N-acetylglucosaminephosphotransferase [Lacimicrobium sp. SS2-24]